MNSTVCPGSQVRGRGEIKRWTLTYPIAEEPVSSPFYSQLPGIGIADLLGFVASKTGFLGAFTHVLDRYVKHAPDPREIRACVVALGTNMGLWKMVEVSGLSFSSLMTTARNFLRPETLRATNDAISNAIAVLPAFHLYDIRDEIHSSSDGQRFETQIDTFNTRHSPKYFGIANGVPLTTDLLHKMIGFGPLVHGICYRPLKRYIQCWTLSRLIDIPSWNVARPQAGVAVDTCLKHRVGRCCYIRPHIHPKRGLCPRRDRRSRFAYL